MATPPRLVDRQFEQEALHSLIEDVRGGEQRAVTVTGPPGHGRSTLLRWAQAAAITVGMQVVAVAAAASEMSLSGGVLYDVVAGLRSLPARSPAMVIVDDLHLADAASLRGLHLLARSSHDAPLLLATSISDAHAGAELGGKALRFALGPLSADGVRSLSIAEREGPVDDRVAELLATGAHGVPAVIRTVLDRLPAGSRRPGPGDRATDPAAGLRGPLRQALHDHTDRVVCGLPKDIVALLRAVSVAGGLLRYGQVAALAGIDSTVASSRRPRLAGTGLIADGERPAPVDPAVGERLLAGIPPAERRELFATAATMAYETGADDDSVVRLLVRGRPISAAWAAALLCRTIDHHAEAGPELLRRVLQEPVGPVDRVRVLIRLALSEHRDAPRAGSRRLGEALAEPSRADVDPLRVRAADLLLVQGATDVVQNVVAKPGGFGPAEQSRVASLLRLSGGTGSAELFGADAEPSWATSDPGWLALAAWHEVARGRNADQARARARAALAASTGAHGPYLPRIVAGRVLALTGDETAAAHTLEAVYADAVRADARAAAVLALVARAEVLYADGRIDLARSALTTAEGLLPADRWHPGLPPVAAAIRALISIGEQATDHPLVGSGSATAVATPLLGTGGAYPEFIRGVVALRDEQHAAAAGHLLSSGQLLVSEGWLNPALLPWRSLAALALHRADDPQAAALADSERQLSMRWGVATPMNQATLVTGLLNGSAAGRRRTVPGGWATLTLSLARERTAPAAAGDDRAASATLSRAEAHTAELAAAGMSNRDIAHILSVALRTVELHLTRVYRKLGINGRAELHRLYQNCRGEG